MGLLIVYIAAYGWVIGWLVGWLDGGWMGIGMAGLDDWIAV